ncbi:MAG: hypothetical protein V3V56_02465 [bacterium]
MSAIPDEFEFFFEKPWSDGLPVVAPTEARIAAMLSGTRRGADELVGRVPPLLGEADVRSVAIHAVMAGCKPAYLPVVIAGLEAILDPRLNLNGVQGTMHTAAPLLIVNGPYAREIGLHGGLGCFGPGFRANATIGRAIRLILLNLGGGIIGRISLSTFGSSARYTFCIAENEAESPWEPYSVTKGFGPEENVITAVMAEGPQVYIDDRTGGAEALFVGLADRMATLGAFNIWLKTQVVVAMAPGHARICTREGLTKADVHARLCALAVRRLGDLKRSGFWYEGLPKKWPGEIDASDDEQLIPAVKDPDDLILIFAGGEPGPQTAVMPGWVDASDSVTKAFEA